MATIMASVMVIMAIFMASVMAINYPELTKADTEIRSLMEMALKHAGGNGYYYESGKEDFFKSLSIKTFECQQTTFHPSSKKTYEKRNELKDIPYKLEIDSTVLNTSEEKTGSFAEGSFMINGTGTTISGNVGANVGANVGGDASASLHKKLEVNHVMNSEPVPPRSTLRHETGYDVYTCKYELSLKINCDINYNIKRQWGLFWWRSSNNGDSITVSAEHVLSMVKGWNEKTKTVTIEYEVLVENDICGIYSLD